MITYVITKTGPSYIFQQVGVKMILFCELCSSRRPRSSVPCANGGSFMANLEFYTSLGRINGVSRMKMQLIP